MTKLPWEDQLGAEATSKKILVIGDLILDNYLFGSVSRISPEAPVPVHHIEKKSQVAGGAANVAINCAKHKPQVLISGRIGSDEMGSELRKQLDQAGVDTSLMLVDKSFATTTKTRVLTKAQQILRFDEEEIRATTAAEAKQLAEGLPWKNLSAVVVSDYGKGFLSEAMLSCVFSEAKKKGIPCIVDPKGEDFSKYAGAFLITPNRKEAEGALQLSGLNCHRDKLCDQFQKQFPNIENAVITLGSEGMQLCAKSGEHFHLAAESKEVFDVTGAGDTVVALFALGICAGISIRESMKFANAAAGVTISKQGTYAPSPSEIIEALTKRDYANSNAKIQTMDHCIKQLNGYKNKKIVFTNGCFDLLHPGHVDYLEKARAMGDVLVVGVNSDDSVKRLKGEARPIQNEHTRKRVLAGLGCVDFVVPFADDTPLGLIEGIRPDVLVKGGDWKIDQIVGGEFVSSYGGKVDNIAITAGQSTTGIIERILRDSK